MSENRSGSGAAPRRGITIMAPSLLSRPRNVAERYPCPDASKPRVVWAIPGFDLHCDVARPHAWLKPNVAPAPKIFLGTGSHCRATGDAADRVRAAIRSAVKAGLPLAGFGFPVVVRPSGECLLSHVRRSRRRRVRVRSHARSRADA